MESWVGECKMRVGLGVGWTCLTAALCSEDWQKRKRISLRDLVKAYLLAISGMWSRRGIGPVRGRFVARGGEEVDSGKAIYRFVVAARMSSLVLGRVGCINASGHAVTG